jgi:P-type Ca2+ transporter type 2C
MDNRKHYSGLSNDQVTENRRKYGTNILTPPKRTSLWRLYLEKFNDPIIRILLIAAVISLGIAFVHREFEETIGIFCAIFLATGIAFWFEMDAEKKFDVLNQVNDDILYKLIRNDKITEVQKKDIVTGDIVMLETGEEVPADGTLLESISLQMDESCLTGEPLIEKTTNPDDFQHDATYPSNHILRGTKVLDGHCIYEVHKVGDATEFGKVAVHAAEISGEQTPLNQQLEKLAKFIGVVGLALAVFTFLARFLKDIFLGDVHYTLTQFGLLGGVLLGATIALVKVWLPIIYDGYELAGKEKKLPSSVSKGSWFRWIGYGIFFFILISIAGWAFGSNPLHAGSWISIDTAGKILSYFMISVALVVVAVPEGLPMSVTLSLALSMRKMLKSNNLVRKMHACETMGATTVICTDKTGTLTQNQMQVSSAEFFALQDGELQQDELSQLVIENIAVNSTAHLDIADPVKPKTLGNPTEAALLLWLHKQNISYLEKRENVDFLEQLTFSTERKYMASMVYSPVLKKKVLYVKGAPEIVLKLCNNALCKEGLKNTSSVTSLIEERLNSFQKQAMRTLGFAYEIVEDDQIRIQGNKLINTNLTFMGFVAISDPIRPEVEQSIKSCMEAGIQLKIVTGDTPGTAIEVGKQIGIIQDDEIEETVITGEKFASLSDEEALEIAGKLKIMCRARPSDKQRLVQMLQRRGCVVAVTGDGTNDAPALNFAHVGLSMGSGTSVAKEASDITLIDDSFGSISNALLWGRTIYRNIQRFIIFQLTINVTALIIDFIGAIFWGKLPLTVTQLLWVNLIMDTFAAGALASLPADPKVLKDKPRDRNAFIVDKPMRKAIFGTGLIFVMMLLALLYYFTKTDIFNTGETGLCVKELTVFFTLFVMLQFWNMFNAKAFFSGRSAFYGLSKSVGFLIVSVVIITGQVLIVEFGGNVFRTVPLSFREWVIIIIASSFVLWIGEIIRLINRKRKKN